MDMPIVYIDHSEIHSGKLQDVTAAVSALVDFVERSEPRLLSYGFHLDPEASEMTLVAIHQDSASLQYHLQIGSPEFRKFGQYIDLRLIEVYGEPTVAVRQLLQEKAEMLGRDAKVVVRERSVGFARIGAAHS
jgi:quinol monooxygenase YgiN